MSKSISDVKRLLAKSNAPSNDYIGVIDEATDEPQYFDPWDLFPVYGAYSSEFDDVALTVLENLVEPDYRKRKDENVAHEMFREMLCKMDLCDYGTSPRVCFPSGEFKELLPTLIKRWKEYYTLVWGNR